MTTEFTESLLKGYQFRLIFFLSFSMSNLLIAENSLSDWLANSDLSFRHRTAFAYQYKEDDGKASAKSITLRNDIMWQSAPFQDFYFFAEWHTNEKLLDKFQDTPYRDSKHFNEYTTLPDPDGARFQEAWLAYKINPKGTVKLGRQRIDDEKFIRHFNWRQTSESYRALSLTYQLPYKSDIYFAFTDRLYDRFMKKVDYERMSIFILRKHIWDRHLLKLRYIETVPENNGTSIHNRGDKKTYSLELSGEKYSILYAFQKASGIKRGLSYFETRVNFSNEEDFQYGLGYKFRQGYEDSYFDTLNSPLPKVKDWTNKYELFSTYTYKELTIDFRNSLIKAKSGTRPIDGLDIELKLHYRINDSAKFSLILNNIRLFGQAKDDNKGDEFVMRFLIEYLF